MNQTVIKSTYVFLYRGYKIFRSRRFALLNSALTRVCIVLAIVTILSNAVYAYKGVRAEPLYRNEKLIHLEPAGDFTIPEAPKRFVQFLIDFEICKPRGNISPLKARTGLGSPAFKINVGETVIEIRPGVCHVFDVSGNHGKRKLLSEIRMEADAFEQRSILKIDLIGDLIVLTVNDSKKVAREIKGVFDPYKISFSAYEECVKIYNTEINDLFIDSIAIFDKLHYIITKAYYKPQQFNKNILGLKNHHLITSNCGQAAPLALINTVACDSFIHDALIEAGAVPGNNLTMDTWNKRKNRRSREPDKRVEGSKIEIKILGKNKLYNMEDILIDNKNKPLDFRFGGNRDFIPIWKSGCVVCLQSCPGAKIGDRSYTIRDLYKGRTSFSVSDKTGLKKNEEIYVKFKKF